MKEKEKQSIRDKIKELEFKRSRRLNANHNLFTFLTILFILFVFLLQEKIEPGYTILIGILVIITVVYLSYFKHDKEEKEIEVLYKQLNK